MLDEILVRNKDSVAHTLKFTPVGEPSNIVPGNQVTIPSGGSIAVTRGAPSQYTYQVIGKPQVAQGSIVVKPLVEPQTHLIKITGWFRTTAAACSPALLENGFEPSELTINAGDKVDVQLLVNGPRSFTSYEQYNQPEGAWFDVTLQTPQQIFENALTDIAFYGRTYSYFDRQSPNFKGEITIVLPSDPRTDTQDNIGCTSDQGY